tara:strand:+ start:276 stop:554 length:279 start_codon:yes stop_codon:yes gene_type:complete
MRKLITAPDGITPFDKEGIAKLNLGENATAGELKIEETRLIQEWNANKYQRDRVVSFPTWQEQLDMQYHDQVNGTTTWKDAVAKVKLDNPKP